MVLVLDVGNASQVGVGSDHDVHKISVSADQACLCVLKVFINLGFNWLKIGFQLIESWVSIDWKLGFNWLKLLHKCAESAAEVINWKLGFNWLKVRFQLIENWFSIEQKLCFKCPAAWCTSDAFWGSGGAL
jgi:hypothetical protein